MVEEYGALGHTSEAPGSPEQIAEHVDWDTTMQIRRRIGETGMGIAEAMDTAQRFCTGWETARTLITSTSTLALPGGFCAGASTDHREKVESESDLITGVCEQVEFIQDAGGIPVILPMPWLARTGADADGYVRVYGEIIRNARHGPLLIHWLGPMFMPELEGYFPGDSFEKVMEIAPGTVRGAKLSIMDDDREIALRRELIERDQLILTGNDHHFGTLIAGTGAALKHTDVGGHEVPLGDFSHALLGIFDAVAAPAALALRLLADGNGSAYFEIMDRCEALGKCVFEAPTHAYKSGLAFIAWLNGSRENLFLVNSLEQQRDRSHLEEVARLASDAGAITDAAHARKAYDAWISREA